jgi:hypothetical protein
MAESETESPEDQPSEPPETTDSVGKIQRRDGTPRPDVPDRFRDIMAMAMQWGPAPPPLADKITADHISTMLGTDRVKVDYDRADAKESRFFQLAAFFGLGIFVLVLVWMLLENGDAQLTRELIIGLSGLLAGAAGGYGIGRNSRDR